MEYADKGFAPLYTGHEPAMLLLHKSACTLVIYIVWFNPEGIRTPNLKVKTICLYH